MPPLRKASSRRRCASVSKLKTVVSKICGVGLERDLRATPLRRAGDLEPGRRNAALVRLRVDLTVAPDLEIERLGQRVDHRDADAVEAAGHLVAVVVELAAGVQHGQHDFGRGLAARVAIHGNAAAVVDHGDRAVDVNRDVDLVAEAGQRLVDRVVDDFVDEMMQSGWPGRPDVHGRAHPHRFEALEHLDAVGGVVVGVPVSVVARRDLRRQRRDVLVFGSVCVFHEYCGRHRGGPYAL